MAEFELGFLGVNATRIFVNFVGTSDTADTFRFIIGAPTNFNLSLTRMTQDADVYLYRDVNNNGIIDAGDGGAITFSNRSSNADDFINRRLTISGAYIVQVRRFGTSNTNYTLRLSNTGSAFGNPSNLLPVELNAGVLGSTPFSRVDSVSTTDIADVYRFTMGTIGNFNATLTGITAGRDVDMRLIRDANNNGIVDAGDERVRAAAGGNRDDVINVRSLAAGNYFLQTYLFSGASSNYRLRMSNTGNSGSLPSNLLATEINAGTLGVTPFQQFRSLGINNASDLYRFTMGATGNFNASLTGITAGRDVDMRLIRDANNNGIVDAGDERVRAAAGGNSDDAINVRSLAAGNYFLQTYLFSGASSNYRLRMSNTGSSGFSPSNLVPTEVNVGVVPPAAVRSGFVSVNDAADTFRFSVASTRSTTLRLSGLAADADLRLIRDINNNQIVDAGEEIARSTLGGVAADQITRTLIGGASYIAQVYLFPTSGSTNYSLSIS